MNVMIKLIMLSICFSSVSSIENTWNRHYHNENTNTNSESNSLQNNVNSRGDYSIINQKVDHFDRFNLDTFEQRYFVNDTYWKGPDSGAPVFFCVGGEGPPLDSTVVKVGNEGSEHCDDAMSMLQELGALAVALEHRFYGSSIPYKNDIKTKKNGKFSNDNLKYHNTEQALQDLKEFVHFIKSKYNILDDRKNKWVTFGGSYPGMMAAFARLRFPHLIHGAVSSSSPLQASVDMPGYNEVVGEALTNTLVGGSDSCLNIVQQGHVDIGTMLQTEEGRRDLEKKFNICNSNNGEAPLDDPSNQSFFAGDGVVYIPAQSNDPACTSALCNIDKICKYLTDDNLSGNTNMDKLINLSSEQNFHQCVNVDFNSMVKAYANPHSSLRSWFWQTCSEYGFYQTCPYESTCPYTRGLHNVTQDLDLCASSFGLLPDTVIEVINETNNTYGGDKIQASRILYPNGDVDPWHALGVLTPPNKDTATLWVEGASHHYWTHPPLPEDSVEIKTARDVIHSTVKQWLDEDDPVCAL